MTVRLISDARGERWQVTYIQPSIVRPAGGSYQLSQGWLCFTGPNGRCVRTPRELFAGDWRRLSALKLRRLLADGIESGAETLLIHAHAPVEGERDGEECPHSTPEPM